MARASSVDPTSFFDYRYLTLYEVLSWISRREPQRKGARLTFAEALNSSDVRNYSDVIGGKVPPRSKDVAALCQLHAALEQGLLRATGRRCAKGSPRQLPAYYWPRLVFSNRAFGDCWYHLFSKELAPRPPSALLPIVHRRRLRRDSGVDQLSRRKPCAFRSETCACNRTNLTGEFLSELLFRADEVLALWPPGARALGSSSVPATGKTFDPEHQHQRKLRQATAVIIDKHITTLYDRAQKDEKKPPNVKELIPLVQGSLRDAGFEASGSRILGVASEPRHEQRRRKPGKTVASERRRKPV
jgi:hypothetical protein